MSSSIVVRNWKFSVYLKRIPLVCGLAMAIIAFAESFGDLEERRALACMEGLFRRLWLSRVVDA